MYANNKFVVIISLMTFILLSTHHDQFFFIKNDDISAVSYHPPFPSVNITAFQKSYFIISNCNWRLVSNVYDSVFYKKIRWGSNFV